MFAVELHAPGAGWYGNRVWDFAMMSPPLLTLTAREAWGRPGVTLRGGVYPLPDLCHSGQRSGQFDVSRYCQVPPIGLEPITR